MAEIDLDTSKLDNGKRSKKTLETYNHDIKTIRLLFKTNNKLLDTKQVVKELKVFYKSNHTIRNKIAFINTYLKTVDGLENKEEAMKNYINEMKILNYDIGRQNAKHEKTDKQKANWITNDDWEKLFNKYKPVDKPILKIEAVDKSGKTKIAKIKTISFICDHHGNNKMFHDYLRKYRDFIILSIYKQVALRNDLIDTVILPTSIYKVLKNIKDENLNHIVINKKTKEIKIILTNYKTAKIQGEKEIPLEDNDKHELYNALSNYYDIGSYIYKQTTANYPKVYLLGLIDGSPMSGNNFCHYFKKLGGCIGKELSTTLIRHCKVSEIYNLEKLEKMAHYMGHSVREALTVYAKL
jgi:hypothetical protein